MRVSLRELFALMLIAALALGWWVDRRRWHAEQQTLRTQMTKTASHVTSLKEMFEQLGCRVRIEGESVNVEGEIHLPQLVVMHSQPGQAAGGSD
jgi:hypothetical protein